MPGGGAISGFGSVRSLDRGLQVLQVVNQRNGAKAADIARATGIPRPTVYRLLETLETQEFVTRDHSSDKWRVTQRVKSLSSGFRDEDWVSQIAVPEMVRLGKEILWPLDLVTFSDYAMDIRESTHYLSPYSIDHGMVGRSLPVLETSGGRAYLAFSTPKVREQTIAGLRERFGLEDPIMMKDGPLGLILDNVRRLGLGYRKEGFRTGTQSMSAPIMRGDRVLSCLTIIWTGSALPFDKALDLYGDKLIASANWIAEAVDREDLA